MVACYVAATGAGNNNGNTVPISEGTLTQPRSWWHGMAFCLQSPSTKETASKERERERANGQKQVAGTSTKCSVNVKFVDLLSANLCQNGAASGYNNTSNNNKNKEKQWVAYLRLVAGNFRF